MAPRQARRTRPQREIGSARASIGYQRPHVSARQNSLRSLHDSQRILEMQMKKIFGLILVAGAGMIAAACSDSTTTPVTSALAASALATAPVSFDQINTSFVGNSDTNSGFAPGGHEDENEDA